MAGKDKEAIVICLDVGPMMNQAPPGYCSDLETATDVVNMILQRKLFSESKDEVCLVLFGTPETANRLSDNGYDNITEARPMGPVDLDLIQFVKNDVKPSDTSADFLDVLTVAMDIIHHVTTAPGSKFTGSRVIICSNLGGEFSEDREDAIIQAMNSKETEINFIGPSSLGDEDDEDGPDQPDQAGPSTSGKPQMKRKPKTPQQNLGEAKMKSIIKAAEGDAFTFGDVIPMLSFFETKPVKQIPWKCNLEIGSQLKVPVCGYTRIKEATPKSWKSIFVKGVNKEYTPKAVTSHHLDDEEETEVEGDDIIDGYRYGSDRIPISKEDKANMDYKLPGKVIQVLGFTKSDHIKRHHYMGKTVLLFVADSNDDPAGVAFSAIVNALYETNSVAIVRRCSTARSQPKIGCLVPHIKADYESLLFFELPFSEDLRTYTFASITQNEKYEPSEQQLQAVDKLIDSMDLMEDKGEDEQDEEEDAVTLNPVFQRVYQCLLHRALYPTESIPDVDPMLSASLDRPHAVTVNSCEAVDEMKQVFKLEEVKKTEKGTAQNVFGAVNQNGDAPPNPAATDADGNVSMADMAQGTITEVGSVNPVSDFQKLIQNTDTAEFEKICKQMQKRVEQLVLESFGNQFFSKALDCLQSLRKEIVQRKEPALFNTFLKDLKQKLKTTHKLAFWQKLCTVLRRYQRKGVIQLILLPGTAISRSIDGDKVTLISQSECPSSDVTDDAVKKFLEDEGSTAPTQDEPMVDDDADNLLDMMD